MKLKYKVVIPARYQSTRLPGKMLRQLAGRSLIEWVFRQAGKSNAESIVIATDHSDIYNTACEFGANVCMTSTDHATGTDRLSEVVSSYDWADDDIIINIQGDEPLIDAGLIDGLALTLHKYENAAIATLATPIKTLQDHFDPNIVKVVFDKNGRALYFSRAVIPWNRDGLTGLDQSDLSSTKRKALYAYRHIGIYAYRVGFLKNYKKLEHCELESLEALEQLRALYHGYQIQVDVIDKPPGHGVDTEEDLRRVEKLLDAEL